MNSDVKQFSLNRELFPRQEKNGSDSTKLICGHLNRVKFKPDIQVYLANRKNHVNQSKSLARASRCLCNIGENLNSAKYKI